MVPLSSYSLPDATMTAPRTLITESPLSIDESTEGEARLRVDLSGKADASHSHEVGDVTGLSGALSDLADGVDSRAPALHTHEIADVAGLATALGGKADSAHSHQISDVTDLQSQLDGKAATAHTHDDRYYTESEVDNALSGKVNTDDPRLSDARPPTAHSHEMSDVTGLATALSGKAATAHSHEIADVTGLQDALNGKAASSHSHSIAQVTDLQMTLDGKAASSHTHGIGDVTGLAAALAGKIASCVHDGEDYPARPTADVVFFIGPGDPESIAQPNDLWFDTGA